MNGKIDASIMGFDVCPRRDETNLQPHQDNWVVTSTGERSCSYCGSLSPLDMFRFLMGVDGIEKSISLSKKGHRIDIDRPGSGPTKYYMVHDDSDTMIKAINAVLLTCRALYSERAKRRRRR